MTKPDAAAATNMPSAATVRTITGQSDPFDQGLPVPVVLRLLAGPGHFTAADLKLYLSTPHWRDKNAEAKRFWGHQCEDCGMPATQTHHTKEGYRFLFREDAARHLRRLCGTDHKRRRRV